MDDDDVSVEYRSRRRHFYDDNLEGTAEDAGQDPFVNTERTKNRPARESPVGQDPDLTNESDFLCPHTQISDTFPDKSPDVQHIVNVLTVQKNALSIAGRFAAGQPFDLQIQKPVAQSLKSDRSIIEVIVDVDGFFATVTAGLGRLSYRCQCGADDIHPSKGPPMKFKQLTIRQIRKRSIRIRSDILQEGLRNVFDHYYPGLQWSEEGLVLPEPYSPLLRYYPEILAVSRRVSRTRSFAGLVPEELSRLSHSVGKMDEDGILTIDDETVKHFKLLADLLKPEYEAFAQTHWEKLNSRDPSVSFDGLWLLYRPGTDAYFETSGVKFSAVIQSFFYENDDDEVAKIEYWMLASSGKTIVRREKLLSIPKYQGDKSITELDLKVFKYINATDRERLQTKMQDRGRLIYRLLRQTSCEMQYDGITTTSDTSLGDLDQEEEPDMKTTTVKGRVIVDHETCLKDGLTMPGSRCSNLDELPWYDTGAVRPPVPYKTYREIDIKSTPSLTDHQYMLLHPELGGFIPKTKERRWLSADFLSEVKRVEDSTKNLVLDKDHLKMIRAMSEQHLGDFAGWGADFIPGKGIGQTVLLHGPPGVGKTYTVECIAEEFERPLLPLSPSDLGTDEDELERRLTEWFTLAERWNAVLLIDEADLFLERRKQADIERNGLVTVFLRQLEYFQGLLFVTTNRVGHIDDAFISRVQVVIKYPKLNDDDRRRIWGAFFDKLEEEQDGQFAVTYSAKEYVLDSPEVSACAWNGRNIRNALQTAMRLAAYDAKGALKDAAGGGGGGKKKVILVKDSHFRQVVSMSRDFQIYLNSIQDADEDLRAARRKDR